MPEEIVMVTTFKRDALLYLCLESIRSEDSRIPILVFSDRNHDSENMRSACGKFGARFTIRTQPLGFGNSYNVIEGLRTCVAMGAEIVHSIEDDTIIHGKYLSWARSKLSINPPQFAVALGRIPGDIHSTWYESPCVSWNASMLAQCLEKVPLGYFADTREEMQKVVDAAFPHSHYRFGSAEQDGLFLRCLEFFKWKTAYPPHSMASHLGFWSEGYNRPSELCPPGTFAEQVEACRKVLHDRTRRIELFGQGITEKEMEGMNA